jgi:hypothetical protein
VILIYMFSYTKQFEHYRLQNKDVSYNGGNADRLQTNPPRN